MIKILCVAYFFLISLNNFGQNSKRKDPMVNFLREYLTIKYSEYQFEHFIYIAAKRQRLYVIQKDTITRSYTISTAENGIGNLSGTFQTPEGLHRIEEKIGEGLPLNAVIKQKRATGHVVEPVLEPMNTQMDFITTRVIHLRGLEEGVNSGEGKDSYLRGIFIHGTHEEGLLGQAASKGCIRMSNEDVIELFNTFEVGTFVVILNN